VLVTAALVCSLAWPVFVIGAFAPKIAGWLLAFVPLHKMIGSGPVPRGGVSAG